LDWALTFTGRQGRKWLVTFITIFEFPIFESERQWPYMVITLVPSSRLHNSHLRRRQSRRKGGREEKTPREPVSLGH